MTHVQAEIASQPDCWVQAAKPATLATEAVLLDFADEQSVVRTRFATSVLALPRAVLKCRETATFWAEAYPATDYRHGPISIAGPRRVVWAFGDIPAGLIADVEATGSVVLT